MSLQIAKIYSRKKTYLIRTSSITSDGVWIGYGQCNIVPHSVDPMELGALVLDAIMRSSTVAHPEKWDGSISAPLLKAAGVKSWKALAKIASYVSAECDHEICIIPHRNGGLTGDDAGFHGLRNQTIRLPLGASTKEVGDAVVEAFTKCT